MNRSAFLERSATAEIPEEHVRFRGPAQLVAHLRALPETEWAEIGRSRGGLPVYGMRFGEGPAPVSIVAGSHADEPAGPMTAQALPQLVRAHFPELLSQCRFHVVPQINPDGAARNQPWFANPPDFAAYARHAVREQPGDDIEFGFADEDGARPENRAAIHFLRPHAPFAAHFSLHGMAFAEGAWHLLCRSWVERAQDLMDTLAALCARCGVPLHDIDRKGEKGFTRLRPGFATTPTATAMRAFFERMGAPDTAARFRPSSMEFIAGLGGDPLCAVSEVPLFRITQGANSLDDPVLPRFRDALEGAVVDERAAAKAVAKLVRDYGVTPVPFTTQIRLQLALVALGVCCRLGRVV